MGTDIEAVQAEAIAGLLNTAFSSREITEIANADPSEFFRRWTCKEAYLKYIGMGFFKSLQHVEILKSGIRHWNRPVCGLLCYAAEPFPGYRLSMVTSAERI